MTQNELDKTEPRDAELDRLRAENERLRAELDGWHSAEIAEMDKLRARVAELEGAVRDTEAKWKPIASAPKDRWILCAWGGKVSTDGVEINVLCWLDSDPPSDDHSTGVWADMEENHYDPHHWMELPDPPEVD